MTSISQEMLRYRGDTINLGDIKAGKVRSAIDLIAGPFRNQYAVHRNHKTRETFVTRILP